MAGATIVASSPDYRTDGLYVGMRYWAIAPMREGAKSDRPTIGGFGGVRIGTGGLGLNLELGVFRDPPPPNVVRGNIVFLPSIAVRIDELFQRR